MENSSIKSEKEAFVSGLNGTTLLEVTVITNVSIVLVSARALVLALSPMIFVKNLWFRFLLEWMVMVFPLVAVTTVLADESLGVLVSTVIVTVLTILMLPSKKETHENTKINVNYLSQPATEEIIEEDFELSDGSEMETESMKENHSFFNCPILAANRLPLITTFRAYTTIISCICILAVDFKVFPRRLAKTEVYGSGLMDTGVGLFVIANALVSPEARGNQMSRGTFVQRLGHTRAAILSSWPLWFIGFVRVFSLKLLGYQEHVSEYGVHWNFFFTLAAIKILSAFIFSFLNTRYCLPVAVILIGTYQTLLSHPSVDLTSVILDDDRSGFFMANKEGLCSCMGYLTIYVVSVQIGAFLIQTKRTTIQSWMNALFKCVVVDVMTWIATLAASEYIQPISRRFANLAFVLWMIALFFEFIIMLLVLDFILIFCIEHHKLPRHSKPDQWILVPKKELQNENIEYKPPPPPTCILGAVNRNLFAYFMISNLATGIVNQLFDTLRTPDIEAMGILCVYTVSTLAVVWFLHIKEISIKFW